MSLLSDPMRSEMRYITTLIGKAESRRTYQVEMVAQFPKGCAFQSGCFSVRGFPGDEYAC